MADMIMNILTVVSILVIIYVVYLMVRLHGNSKSSDTADSHAEQYADDEYARILDNVRSIEMSRQPNTGIHHDDESVYISRGKDIKDRTAFFKLVNR